MEECDKSKSEDYKVKEQKERQTKIDFNEELFDDCCVSIYDVRKRLQEYDILGNT